MSILDKHTGKPNGDGAGTGDGGIGYWDDKYRGIGYGGGSGAAVIAHPDFWGVGVPGGLGDGNGSASGCEDCGGYGYRNGSGQG